MMKPDIAVLTFMLFLTGGVHAQVSIESGNPPITADPCPVGCVEMIIWVENTNGETVVLNADAAGPRWASNYYWERIT